MVWGRVTVPCLGYLNGSCLGLQWRTPSTLRSCRSWSGCACSSTPLGIPTSQTVSTRCTTTETVAGCILHPFCCCCFCFPSQLFLQYNATLLPGVSTIALGLLYGAAKYTHSWQTVKHEITTTENVKHLGKKSFIVAKTTAKNCSMPLTERIWRQKGGPVESSNNKGLCT